MRIFSSVTGGFDVLRISGGRIGNEVASGRSVGPSRMSCHPAGDLLCLRECCTPSREKCHLMTLFRGWRLAFSDISVASVLLVFVFFELMESRTGRCSGSTDSCTSRVPSIAQNVTFRVFPLVFFFPLSNSLVPLLCARAFYW